MGGGVLIRRTTTKVPSALVKTNPRINKSVTSNRHDHFVRREGGRLTDITLKPEGEEFPGSVRHTLNSTFHGQEHVRNEV